MSACLVVAVCALATGGAGVAAAYYEGTSQLLQRLPDPDLMHRYGAALPPLPPSAGGGDWLDAPDPRLYLLTENEMDNAQGVGGGGGARLKRTGLGGGPSLSIVNPLDVLRQRLLLEIARRRMRQSEEKIEANRQFLKTIGKRSLPQPLNLPDTDDHRPNKRGGSSQRQTAADNDS